MRIFFIDTFKSEVFWPELTFQGNLSFEAKSRVLAVQSTTERN